MLRMAGLVRLRTRLLPELRHSTGKFAGIVAILFAELSAFIKAKLAGLGGGCCPT
jgi:hypothetical protein